MKDSKMAENMAHNRSVWHMKPNTGPLPNGGRRIGEREKSRGTLPFIDVSLHGQDVNLWSILVSDAMA